MRPVRNLALFAVVLAAEPAFAHSVSARFGELYSGLLHPITTLVHLVPWIALGLLGGSLETPKARTVLYVFPGSVAVGALCATVLPDLQWILAVNILSIVILGLLVVISWELPLGAFVALTAAFGLTHGVANNATTLTGGPLLLYVLGLALSAYLVVAMSAALSSWVNRRTRWGTIAVRAAGSWVVAIGVIFGGYTLGIAS